MIDIELDESLIVKVYRQMLDNKDRYNIFYGSAGSGKSWFGIGQRTVFECLDQSNNRFLIVRKVANTLRDSVFKEVCDTISMWGLDDLFRVNNTGMSIKGPNGNIILFKGCDKVGKLKSISKITRLKIEEADELTEEEFNQLDLRLRGSLSNYKQISLHFNPVDEDHWIKARFFDGRVDYSKNFNRYSETVINPEGKIVTVYTSILKTTYRDNPYAGAEYEAIMQKLKDTDPVYYQVYALAEWGVIKPERPFADNFSRAKHVKRGLKYEEGYDLFIKCDFNVENTFIVGQNVYDEYGNLKIRDLKEYHQKGWDLERLCLEVITDFPNATIKINGDASGNAGNALTAGNQSAYELVKEYLNLSWMQFNVPTVNPSHLNSRLLTNLILKTNYGENNYLYEVDEEGCPNLIRDFERVYVDRSGSLDECKRKKPELTHFLDPVRYHFNAEHYERIKEIGYNKLVNR